MASRTRARRRTWNSPAQRRKPAGIGVGGRARSWSAASSPEQDQRWSASRICWVSGFQPAAAAAQACRPVHRRSDRRSPRATWWCTRNTASAAMTGWRPCSVGPAPHDCLRLIYDGSQKLYLPVENIEVLSPLRERDRWRGAGQAGRRELADAQGADEAAHPGHGGRADPHRCRAPGAGSDDAGSSRRKLGRVLCPLPVRRDRGPGSGRSADVLEDMAAGRPMDRLICGDVGFGKTEVALRAAFVAAMSGAQVAVVVPTTLLARQHHRTFSARFAGLPVKVAPTLPHGDGQGGRRDQGAAWPTAWPSTSSSAPMRCWRRGSNSPTSSC